MFQNISSFFLILAHGKGFKWMFKEEGKSLSKKKIKYCLGFWPGEMVSLFIYHFCHIPANFTKFLKWSEVLMQVNSSPLLLHSADKIWEVFIFHRDRSDGKIINLLACSTHYLIFKKKLSCWPNAMSSWVQQNKQRYKICIYLTTLTLNNLNVWK